MPARKGAPRTRGAAPLAEYRRKRAFSRTPEPAGEVAPQPGRALRFVVHEHHARRLHWDLRLEMAGVLRSWAVPKGPSLDPRDSRLAVLVEDHPIAYGEFEGTIPEGEYGAGTVMVWDRGTYEVAGDPVTAFEEGKLTITFHGRKLRGRFHLIRTGRPEPSSWLLRKGADQYAVQGYTPAGTASVATGRTPEEIRAGAPPKRTR